MKILVVHNRYHLRGGEEGVYEAEVKMLRNNGHEVESFEANSQTINSLIDKVIVGIDQIFSMRTYVRMRRKIMEFEPDIVHVHNFFPLISPSVFYACKRSGVPVIQTLHNFRAICPTGLLLLNGQIEEKSISNGPFWAIKHAAYRNSRIGTALLALSIFVHRRIGTWRTQVDKFIALTEFQKEKYVSAGWPEEKFVIKPNFVDTPAGGFSGTAKNTGGYFIYVGRLSDEKGVSDLVEAWRDIKYPLKIVGDGPLSDLIRTEENPFIEWLGPKSKEEVFKLLEGADLTIMTSRCYEGFPLVLLESFACSTPALVPRLGGLPHIVAPGETGFLYEPRDIPDLRIKLNDAIRDRAELARLGLNARQRYLDSYTEQRNYEYLVAIYSQLLPEWDLASSEDENYEYE